MKTILCLTDFSATATHAAKYGYYLAKLLEAEIIFCNVINVPAEVPQYEVVLWPPEHYDLAEEDAMDTLKKLKKSFEHNDREPGFHPPISCLFETGIVTNVVNAITNNRKIDMIVMGTHASSGLKHLLLGNHTRYMIDAATVPLLLVPPEVKLLKLNWIAFATDFDLKDLEAAVKLAELAMLLNANTILMHIMSKKKALQSEIKQQQDEFMAQLRKNTGYKNISCQLFIENSVSGGLEKLCLKNENKGLLAIVHKNRNFINEILKGSSTQKAANRLSLPLLVLPNTPH